MASASDRQPSARGIAISLFCMEKTDGDCTRGLGNLRQTLRQSGGYDPQKCRKSLRDLDLQFAAQSECKVLKILVSVVRFRPRPPNSKNQLLPSWFFFVLSSPKKFVSLMKSTTYLEPRSLATFADRPDKYQKVRGLPPNDAGTFAGTQENTVRFLVNTDAGGISLLTFCWRVRRY